MTTIKCNDDDGEVNDDESTAVGEYKKMRWESRELSQVHPRQNCKKSHQEGGTVKLIFKVDFRLRDGVKKVK